MSKKRRNNYKFESIVCLGFVFFFFNGTGQGMANAFFCTVCSVPVIFEMSESDPAHAEMCEDLSIDFNKHDSVSGWL